MGRAPEAERDFLFLPCSLVRVFAMPRFSLIMATVGRSDPVVQLLTSLKEQTFSDFELIVVDQNDDDRLVPLLATCVPTLSVLHLRSARGLSRARNVGLEHATGELIGFPDDDCHYPPDFLERVSARFERFADERTSVGVVLGRNRDPQDPEDRLGAGDVARFLDHRSLWKYAVSTGLFFRKDVVDTIGGFDETLGVGSGTLWGSGEDLDYPWRALSAGYAVWYEPSIFAYHPVLYKRGEHLSPEDLAKRAARAFSYGAGVGRVWRLNGLPLLDVLYYLLRPAGGALVYLAQRDRMGAVTCLRSLQGRVRGWIS